MIHDPDDERMDFREATDREHAMVGDLIRAVLAAVDDVSPSEDDYPGITGLIVTALVHVAGEMVRDVPTCQRASVLAHYQGYMAAAAGEAETVQ